MGTTMYEEIKDYKGTRPRKYNLISGEKLDADNPAVIAYCASYSHLGFLTVKLIAEHQCFLKNCRHLRKLPEKPYWEKPRYEHWKQIYKRNTKEGRKILKEQETRFANRAEKMCQQLMDFSEEWVKNHSLEEELKVLSISPFNDSTRNFRLYYISIHLCYDAPLYIELVKDIQTEFRVRIKLVHIKNTRGEWATIEEYNYMKKYIK